MLISLDNYLENDNYYCNFKILLYLGINYSLCITCENLYDNYVYVFVLLSMKFDHTYFWHVTAPWEIQRSYTTIDGWTLSKIFSMSVARLIDVSCRTSSVQFGILSPS